MKKLFFLLLLMANLGVMAQTEYIHSEKPSRKSQFLQFGMKLLGMKKQFNNVLTKNSYTHTEAKISKSLTKNFNAQKHDFMGNHYWEIRSKTPSEKAIFYIHGGAYVNALGKFHWDLIEKLAQKTNATIFVPDYPLSPMATHKEAHAFIAGVYDEILKTHNADNVVIMGDSAGGGLGLSFTMTLRDENRPLPKQLILLSPWLDVTMQNPEIASVENLDKMLGIKGLVTTGEAYAKGGKTTDYLVSPIFGNLKNLPPIATFIGTHDVFIADNRKFKTMLKAVGNPYHYFEYPKMFHVWTAVVSLPESQKAIEQMAELIKK